MYGFWPMETIVETASNPNSNPQSPTAPIITMPIPRSPTTTQDRDAQERERERERDQTIEALLQSFDRPHAPKDSNLFPQLDLPLRSSSISKMPTRKPSQRVLDWMNVKRSNTVRTAKIAEAISPTTGRHKINIAHLGGGRLGSDEIQPAIAVGLMPQLVRPQRRRADSDSAENRMTQWIDLYNPLDGLESLSPPPQVERPRVLLSNSHTTKPHERSNEPEKPASSQLNYVELEEQSGLRPAPLRTPTRKETPESAIPSERPASHESSRGRSKSRKRVASPPVPSRASDSSSARGSNMSSLSSSSASSSQGHVRKSSKWKPLPQLPSQVAAIVEKPRTPAPSDVSAPSAPELATPPLTPVSEKHKVIHSVGVQISQISEEEEVSVDLPSEIPVTLSVSRSGSASTSGSVTSRYTRKERIWLHSNYRGEAPFLQAWGLDIEKDDDRREGVRIVRELMDAEASHGAREHRQEGSKGQGHGEERYELS